MQPVTRCSLDVVINSKGMPKKRIYLIVIFFNLIMTDVNGQVRRVENWDKLQSKRGKIYFNQQGFFIGCDGIAECMAFDVVFYAAGYDAQKHQFSISGTIYIEGTSRDSVKLGAVRICLAQPVKDTLVNIREIGQTVSGKSNNADFPGRRGDFQLSFFADKADKLYFICGTYGLVEYNIDRIEL
ncbi:MAG: hypothetical protein QM731_02105 [Chitinophagaceae bacterium]